MRWDGRSTRGLTGDGEEGGAPHDAPDPAEQEEEGEEELHQRHSAVGPHHAASGGSFRSYMAATQHRQTRHEGAWNTGRWSLLWACHTYWILHPLAPLSTFLIGRTFVREHTWEYSANIVGAKLLLREYSWGIRRTATKPYSGSRKFRSTCSGNIHPDRRTLSLIGWEPRALLWMRKK